MINAPMRASRNMFSNGAEDFDFVAACSEDPARSNTDETVRSPLLPPDDTLEQERIRPPAESRKCQNWSQTVHEHLAIDERQLCFTDRLEEFAPIWHESRH
jgi:hypothetical protein